MVVYVPQIFKDFLFFNLDLLSQIETSILNMIDINLENLNIDKGLSKMV